MLFWLFFLSLLYNEDTGIFGVPHGFARKWQKERLWGQSSLCVTKVSSVYITGEFWELCACSILFGNPLMNILRSKDTKAPLGLGCLWLLASLLASTWQSKAPGCICLAKNLCCIVQPRKHQVTDTDVSHGFLLLHLFRYFKCYLCVCMCLCVYMIILFWIR